MRRDDQTSRDGRAPGAPGPRSARRRGLRVGGFWRAMGLMVALSAIWTLIDWIL